MYIVISKPKRKSVALGVSQVMVSLLVVKEDAETLCTDDEVWAAMPRSSWPGS